MIVERYDPVNLFELVPTKLRLEMKPELAALDRLLERRSYSQGLRANCLGYTAPGLDAVGGDPATVDASTR